MNKNKQFWIATSIAGLALLISIVSAIINEIRYMNNEQEVMCIRLNKFFGEYPISTINKYPALNGNGVINVVWEVILSNIGKTSISITDYDLWTVDKSGSLIQYSGFNQGLFNTKLTKVNLPINIPPGTSIKLHLKTGLSLGEKASKLISLAPLDVKKRIMKLSKYLAGKGKIDIFDNPVTPLWDVTKTTVRGFRVENQKNDQVILISFRTAKKNNFSDISRWYEFSK